MPTITIPKEITEHKDLVVVPRSDYEEFLAWKKRVAFFPTFKPTKAEKKALARGRANYAKGNYVSLEEARHALGIKSR